MTFLVMLLRRLFVILRDDGQFFQGSFHQGFSGLTQLSQAIATYN
ncbi:hypothetical protein [Brasilonema bromeliae]|nr:hypothetical protein [Brasilonema bromeliae]